MRSLAGEEMVSEEIALELKRIKKRDLFQTYFFKMACRAFGPPKSRDRIIIAPPMPKLNPTPKTPGYEPSKSRPVPHTAAGDGVSPVAQRFESFPGVHAVEHADWIRERRAFRAALDGIGDLSAWIHNKPTLTELELLVTDREKRTERTPSPPETRVYRSPPPSPPHTTATTAVSRLTPKGASSRALTARSPLREVTEVRKYLRTHNLSPSELSKHLDRRGTGKLSRSDFRYLFEKEGIPVAAERLNDLVLSLNSHDGNSVMMGDLTAGIRVWGQLSHDREERGSAARNSLGLSGAERSGEPQASEGLQRRDTRRESRGRVSQWGAGSRRPTQPLPSHTDTPPLSLEEQEEHNRIQQHRRQRRKVSMKDEEVLAIMRTVRTGNKTQDAHSCPSSLSGHSGQAVDRFRRQCLGEYLDSLQQCKEQELTVNQATLERVLLYPGDRLLGGGVRCGGVTLRQAGSSPLLGCRGRLRSVVGWSNASTPRVEKEEKKDDLEEVVAPHKVRKEMTVYPSWRAVRRGPKIMTLSTGRAEVRHKTECWLTREEYAYMTRNRRQQSIRHADPNAFWPGQDDHVRLYLPQVGLPPENVLFQRIERTPAPCPGSWPVNESGYSTSGDIDGHKAYTF